MATTKYRIAEQIQRIILGGSNASTRKVAIQELIIAVSQALGTAVKASWFANKNDGFSEVAGTFIYTFKDINILLDTALTQYYAVMPSNYIDLPHEGGIQTVAFMPVSGKQMGQPLVRVPNGYNSLMIGLAVENMEKRDIFYMEGNKIILPDVTTLTKDLKLYMALTVSLEGIDEDEPINISPEIQAQIVQSVTQLYMTEEKQPDNNNSNSLST